MRQPSRQDTHNIPAVYSAFQMRYHQYKSYSLSTRYKSPETHPEKAHHKQQIDTLAATVPTENIQTALHKADIHNFHTK